MDDRTRAALHFRYRDDVSVCGTPGDVTSDTRLVTCDRCRSNEVYRATPPTTESE